MSECGTSDLVQDIRDFPPTWRRRARDWIGDINDPDDLRQLVETSPLTHVDRVRARVLLIHGSNDTDVPVTSSDRFYKRVVDLGKPVRFERIDGAGHAVSQQVDVISLTRDWLIENL